MKKYLIVYYGDASECVEGFPKECKRLEVPTREDKKKLVPRKGALHLNPGRKMEVTEDELKHIKSHYKHCLPKLKTVSEMDPKKKGKSLDGKKLKADAKAAVEARAKRDAKAQEGKKTTKKKASSRRG